MRRFVPVTDEMLYRPDGLRMLLVPYRCDLPCWHQLQEEAPQAFVSLIATDMVEHKSVFSA